MLILRCIRPPLGCSTGLSFLRISRSIKCTIQETCFRGRQGSCTYRSQGSCGNLSAQARPRTAENQPSKAEGKDAFTVDSLVSQMKVTCARLPKYAVVLYRTVIGRC